MSATRICASRTCRKRLRPESRRKYCSNACSKNENQRKYAEAHPEKVKRAMRSWAERNRDHRREYNRDKQRKWRAANLDRERKRARIYARNWRRQHHDQFIATQRKRYAAKRDSLLEQRREKEGSVPRAKYLERLRRPQKPGRPAGRMAGDTADRITVIAYCLSLNISKRRVYKEWALLTGGHFGHLSPNTVKSFVKDHEVAIRQRQAELAALETADSSAIARAAGYREH